MVPAPFVVVLDANVLFPFTLRDTLLRAAAAGFYQVRWSSRILDEMTRNLVGTRTMPEDRVRRLRAIIEREFPEAEVTGYEHLIGRDAERSEGSARRCRRRESGRAGNRHGKSEGFRVLPAGIEVQSPDEFLCNLFDLDPNGFEELLREQATDLVKPPTTFEELLERLVRVVPVMVDAVRRHIARA
jgi:hypothetical protein